MNQKTAYIFFILPPSSFILPLPRRQNARHRAAGVHPRDRFDLGDVIQRRNHAHQDFSTLFMVRVLAAAEEDVDLHLVAVLQESARLFDLEVDVVPARLGTQANLFYLLLVLLGAFGLLSFLLILEFAVIHDAADGRPDVGRDFHQIQARLDGQLLRLGRRQDTQHLAFRAHQADRRNANLIVNSMRRFDR